MRRRHLISNTDYVTECGKILASAKMRCLKNSMWDLAQCSETPQFGNNEQRAANRYGGHGWLMTFLDVIVHVFMRTCGRQTGVLGMDNDYMTQRTVGCNNLSILICPLFAYLSLYKLECLQPMSSLGFASSRCRVTRHDPTCGETCVCCSGCVPSLPCMAPRWNAENVSVDEARKYGSQGIHRPPH